MILLGTVIRETRCIRDETVEDALKHVIPARKMNLMDVNLKAIQAGKEYQP
jgi:Pyruvate/2-oxoacid:ferredoxin oxidoreductase gamma subunit